MTPHHIFFPKVFRGVFAVSVIASLTLAIPTQAAIGDVSTWMSKTYDGDGGDANQAFLDNPQGFTADSSCSLYIADTQNFVVRKIDGATNAISTFAGSGKYGLTNGTTAKAAFRSPADIELGADGKMYVADGDNKAIRLISGGLVTTWLAGLKNPTGLAIDDTYLYISETGKNRILKARLSDGVVSTVASITSPGKLDTLSGFLYVVHGGKTAFAKIDLSTGAVTDLKTGMQDAEGVRIYNGQVYVVSGTNGTTNQVWKYDPSSGTITLLVDVPEDEWYNHIVDLLVCGGKMKLLFREGSSVYNADLDATHPVKIAGLHRWNDRNGAKSQALVGRPWYFVRSPDRKKLYILQNHKISVLDLETNIMSFLAGYANDNYRDGVGDQARISGAMQMAISPDGKKLYIADRQNNRIRILDVATAAMTTLTGAGKFNMFSNVKNMYQEGVACPDTFDLNIAGCAYFDRPTGIAVSADGKTLYVADSGNGRIRRVNATTGATSLLVGSTRGYRNGVGSRAQFRKLHTLLLSKDGKKLYVVDQNNHAIRQVNLTTKRVTTLFGVGRAGYREGGSAHAVLSYPEMLAQGPGNTLFLSEVGSQRIRQLNLTTHRTSFVAGSGKRGNDNGAARIATFNTPRGMIMLTSRTLLVADYFNDLIRRVSLK